MLSYRLGRINDFHWGFKKVFSYNKPYTFSTFIGEENENERQKEMHLLIKLVLCNVLILLSEKL